MKKEVKLIAVVFNSDNKILLEKTKEEYIPPFGYIEDNERIEDAYKRIILASTGLTIEMLDIVAAFNFSEIDQISIVYACTPLNKYKPTMELPKQYSWHSEKEIKDMKVPYPYREMIGRAYFKS